jgi:perosamine synthetase
MNASLLPINQVDLFVDDRELALVSQALEQRWLTEGKFTKALIEKISRKLDVKHVFLVPNGTLALYLALLGLECEPDSEIIIPSFTFYGSATSAVFAGLKPVFIDCDPKTFNATPEAFEAAITPRTRAIMPVHIYGQVCDMEGIMAVARKHGLLVIEDAAQAFGVTLNGRSAGTFGDIATFSFYSDKVITTGEGGCVVTNDDDLARKIALLRNQGRPNSGTFVHPSLGMNFRTTDLQSAIGVVQMDKLQTIVDGRTLKWQRYMAGLKGIGDLGFMEIVPGSTLIPFRFPILSGRRDELAAALEAQGIQTRGFFYPMHLQPKLMASPPQSLPVSEDLNRRGICLPVHHHLSDAMIDRIVLAIRGFFGA